VELEAIVAVEMVMVQAAVEAVLAMPEVMLQVELVEMVEVVLLLPFLAQH
jgi:hypothetical protein